ncbi:MAG: L-seryl-tRNA(Sec) selenium transferase [Acidobacteria bacterium]|nr:L-seryl-tRNA(Sec) selenium transferase [Acidobacteriota bacterium]MCA1627081.1 L-seryl-tRNA(Sec) selenium transferase [Acidobacteriota bacterium]
MAKRKETASSNLRHVPSVDQLLRTETARRLRETIGLKRVTAIARTVASEIRSSIRDNLEVNGHSQEALLAEATRRMEETAQRENETGIKKVINATGVLLHTNLGRAPLSTAARAAIDEAAGYCNLEYDVVTGTRGKRGARVESLLKDLTGAEAALVVNNCAAAALLILTVLAQDGETIVSRGELVEIGGDFRVPDVMASSGTRMIEVGTTNRTHLEDYRRAINANTRLMMRVHPSNYRIVGFASTPQLSELAALAHEHSLPLYEDGGSGVLSDLSAYGVVDEPTVSEIVAAGADVVSFSGDKLLGSAQAGLIVGKQAIVDRLRKHPLYRALRSDKLRLAALEATLADHQRDRAASEVPVLQMLALTASELEERARHVIEQVSPTDVSMDVEEGESAVGGGSAPTSQLRSALIAVSHPRKSASELEQQLRNCSPSIVARIANDKVLLDLRTVAVPDLPALISTLKTL